MTDDEARRIQLENAELRRREDAAAILLDALEAIRDGDKQPQLTAMKALAIYNGELLK
jgi:hypothetical protein